MNKPIKQQRFKPNEKGYKGSTLNIRLDEITTKNLNKLAERKNLTKSELIRHLINTAK